MKNIDLRQLSWCNASSRKVDIDKIIDHIDCNKKKSEIHIGCDSHNIKDKCIFAIVVAIYEPGKGGTYFFARKRINKKQIPNMKMRLLKEVDIAISLANMINSRISLDKTFVHLDINPDKKFKSHQVFTSATSWVKSQGYDCVVKPDSWASSWLADAYAK